MSILLQGLLRGELPRAVEMRVPTLSITNRPAAEPHDRVHDWRPPGFIVDEDALLAAMRLLIVDGNDGGAEMLERLLRQSGYETVLATSNQTDLPSLCLAWSPDLILLDVPTPHRPVGEILDSIASTNGGTLSCPVVAVVPDGAAARQEALAHGACDFVTKPIDKVELLLRLRNLLLRRHLQFELDQRDRTLDAAVWARTAELEQSCLEGLSVLASAAEYYEPDTPRHTRQVGVTAALLSKALGLPDSFGAAIRNAAPLHDIGKIGVSRRVLLKPDALSQAERAHMMNHVEIGFQILALAESPVLRLAAEIARTHHERWDGQGYLVGLAGEDIPISGRITSVADAFDALTHERSYKQALDPSAALAEIEARAGTQFDPQVVEALRAVDLKVSEEPAPFSAGPPTERP